MWIALLKWLFGTAMGRGVVLGGSVAIGMLIGWYAFSTHYYNEGVASCQLKRVSDTNAANVAQGEKNIANNQTSTQIAKQTDEEAAKVVEDAEQARQETKESVNEIYRKPPVTAPVSIGSCVHPLDDRVQSRIDEARDAAVEARSP